MAGNVKLFSEAIEFLGEHEALVCVEVTGQRFQFRFQFDPDFCAAFSFHASSVAKTAGQWLSM
jgi:hypothetical protein